VERPVKERLVGAAVLMAAAIILIPEMLSGPDKGAAANPGTNAARSASAKAGGDGEVVAGRSGAPIKTYTIDLNQSPGGVAANIDANRAPPPEDVPLSPPAAPESATPDTQAKPEPADEPPSQAGEPPASEARAPVSAASQAVVEPPTRTPPPSASPPPRPLASNSAAPTSSAWAVQLGSFSKQSTAEKLANAVRAQGHDAFVMPVKSGAATLYRVRIGPMKDRASAEAVLRSVKAKVPGAALVAHP
jgi:DedD protein